MQNLEDENNHSAVEAAATTNGGAKPEPSASLQAPALKQAAFSVKPPVTPPSVEAKAPAAVASAAPAPEAAPEKPVATPTPAAAPAMQPSVAQHAPHAPEEKQYITIDDFSKVELRVAQILVAERIPKADKLLRLEVDLGYEKRQILAGIAQYYEPEKLVGRKIVIVANLAPRKMRGLESNGMLLAASLEGGAPVLTGFLEEVPLGSRLK
jgi:methionyl-tRNA synthetase